MGIPGMPREGGNRVNRGNRGEGNEMGRETRGDKMEEGVEAASDAVSGRKVQKHGGRCHDDVRSITAQLDLMHVPLTCTFIILS